MNTSKRSALSTGLYRRVWRWHFYAGLICLPFLSMMALTGALYLFKEPLESLVYARLLFVDTSPAGAHLDAETLLARARSAVAGEPVRYVGPVRPGRSAEVEIGTAAGTVSVYLDPVNGRVLGSLRHELKLSELIRHIHSLAIAGTVANHWIEVVAGWAIVLVVSGVFLWLPRGRSGGVCSIRGRPAQRTWWRDLHAVTGLIAASVLLFLAVTGMPWSAFWGQHFMRLTNQWGIGLPSYLVDSAPESSPRLSSLGKAPWALAQMSVPESTHHAGHGEGETRNSGTAVSTASIGLNDALRRFAQLGLPAGVPVSLPEGPLGVFTAMNFPDDVRGERVVHLDRYSGAVLADVGYANYGVAGRLTDWGINLHLGVQFGLVNQLVMLTGCISILVLTVSAVVMWWKRRPRGRWHHHLASPATGRRSAPWRRPPCWA